MHLFRRTRAEAPQARAGGTRRSYAAAVGVPALMVVLCGFLDPPVLRDLRNLVFDGYQRLAPRVWDADAPVRIVDIDDESLARVGQWPWPRSTVATLVDRLREGGAASIAFDIVFSEPDATSAEAVIRRLPPTPGRAMLEQELGRAESNDAVLARALAATPAILGAGLSDGGGGRAFPTRFGIATAGDDPHPFLPAFTRAVVPLPALSRASAGVGVVNWLADRDQVVRRVPLLLALDDKDVPSLALEALRVAQGASTIVVRASNASGQTAFGARSGVNAIKVGALEIPTDAHGELRVRYTRSEPRRFIPAWKVLAGTVEPDAVRERLMVIGISALALRDQRATPVDASVAGVEIHAQVIEQVLAGAWLVRPDWALGAELVLAALLALGIAIELPQVTPAAGALGTALLIATLGAASWHEFSADGLLLDPVIPGACALLTYGAGVIWLHRDEQRRRRQVREAFGRYVSPAVVARLAEDPQKLVLGGETRTLTIMFCDVRGFTSLAERLDAAGLTRFMNEYLTAMTDAILRHGGTIDKYIGDAVMAFWNAPLDDADHARHAALAALAMSDALDALNLRLRERAAERGETPIVVSFGIGLATGTCSVGNFGSQQRFDYSAMGDQVNLASRLEGATKHFRTDVLAAQATRERAPDLAWLEVDAVRVKGKAEIVRVHALAGDEGVRRSAEFGALAKAHDAMIESYRRADFARAIALARELRGTAPPRLRDLYAGFARRWEPLVQSRPDAWTPITELTEK
ncbi:MAG TPA: adenylate/guanylate cyclase domain-containing protein [Xanthobacteraceae bacterium]|nr:adenylate/guanylate cyclase domain-containing protein [Xanthobacteraceae bacterium]